MDVFQKISNFFSNFFSQNFRFLTDFHKKWPFFRKSQIFFSKFFFQNFRFLTDFRKIWPFFEKCQNYDFSEKWLYFEKFFRILKARAQLQPEATIVRDLARKRVFWNFRFLTDFHKNHHFSKNLKITIFLKMALFWKILSNFESSCSTTAGGNNCAQFGP